MTKLREPDSIQAAVLQVRVLLGDTKVLEIIGRKLSLLKSWSDPDDAQRGISLRAAKLLDVELVRQGHEPIFMRLLEQSVADLHPAPSEEPPLEQAMNCVTAAARTLEETRSALKDQHISPHERISLLRHVAALQKGLGAFKRSLFLKPPAKR